MSGASLCGLEFGGCASPGASSAPACAEPSQNIDPTHCLVEKTLVRVAGAASLTVGEAVLTNVDDNTAVIVARDAAGLHALSGICTHACCIVSLCGDARCSNSTPTPGSCGSTRIAHGNAEGQSILCPCHGSTFRLSDGVPLNGPTATPLPAYALSIGGDDVIVDTGKSVDVSVRF